MSDLLAKLCEILARWFRPTPTPEPTPAPIPEPAPPPRPVPPPATPNPPSRRDQRGPGLDRAGDPGRGRIARAPARRLPGRESMASSGEISITATSPTGSPRSTPTSRRRGHRRRASRRDGRGRRLDGRARPTGPTSSATTTAWGSAPAATTSAARSTGARLRRDVTLDRLKRRSMEGERGRRPLANAQPSGRSESSRRRRRSDTSWLAGRLEPEAARPSSGPWATRPVAHGLDETRRIATTSKRWPCSRHSGRSVETTGRPAAM